MNNNSNHSDCLRTRFVAFAKKQRCLLLLVSLLALLVLYPYLGEDKDNATIFFKLLITSVLIGGVYATSRKRWHFILAILLLVPAMTGNWVELQVNKDQVEINGLATGAQIVFYIFLTVMVISYVVHSKSVTGDKFAGRTDRRICDARND